MASEGHAEVDQPEVSQDGGRADFISCRASPDPILNGELTDYQAVKEHRPFGLVISYLCMAKGGCGQPGGYCVLKGAQSTHRALDGGSQCSMLFLMK